MSIGQRIKKARKEAKLTQMELAKKTNLSRSYIGDIEIDRYNPSISTLQSIAEATGVTASFLLGKDTSDSTGYYHDPEVAELAEELRTNPGMKVLFDASKHAKQEDLQYAADLLKRLKGDEE